MKHTKYIQVLQFIVAYFGISFNDIVDSKWVDGRCFVTFIEGRWMRGYITLKDQAEEDRIYPRTDLACSFTDTLPDVEYLINNSEIRDENNPPIHAIAGIAFDTMYSPPTRRQMHRILKRYARFAEGKQ